MIITKAPLRISLFGGGSDLPSYYNKKIGYTLSFAFNKYVYCCIMNTPKNHIKISYSIQEDVENVEDIKHDIVRESLKYFNIKSNIEITSFSDIPTIGSGLGGSSAFTLCLILGLAEYTGKKYSKDDIIKIACKIEQKISPVGLQDHYSCGNGGFNLFTYNKSVDYEFPLVSKMTIDNSNIENHIFLVPTKISRSANEILQDVQKEENTDIFEELSFQAIKVTHILNDNTLTDNQKYVFLGKELDKAWNLKKRTSNMITNSDIDDIYDRGKFLGANGGKLLGAGGGGYFVFSTNEKICEKAIFNHNIIIPKIDKDGVRVVLNDN